MIVHDGGVLRDYRLDRGRIRAVSADSLTLLERDGTVVIVPVASTAEIRLTGRIVLASPARGCRR